VFTVSTIAYENVETIDDRQLTATRGAEVCRGQHGLGIVRSYELNLPKF
jgi:hypothetical protein